MAMLATCSLVLASEAGCVSGKCSVPRTFFIIFARTFLRSYEAFFAKLLIMKMLHDMYVLLSLLFFFSCILYHFLEVLDNRLFTLVFSSLQRYPVPKKIVSFCNFSRNRPAHPLPRCFPASPSSTLACQVSRTLHRSRNTSVMEYFLGLRTWNCKFLAC